MASFGFCVGFKFPLLSSVPYYAENCRLLDVKQGQNKEGKTVLYLVFEYMETDMKKFIRSFRSTGEDIPARTVKVLTRKLDSCLIIGSITVF